MINETPPPGTLLGQRYRLLDSIGHGGMARVFRALDAELDREVAVKLLREPLESGVARFEREAKLMARLRHPAIVKVHGFGVIDDGRPYLVLELIDDAITLTDFLADEGPLTARHAARLMLPIVGALAEAHQNGIVHRDLKPDNILIQRAPGVEAQLRLIDFGIAAWDGPAAQRLTRTGELFGTPAYMSPEHSMGTISAGPPSDVWAMGCILYEMVVGRVPFAGPNVPSTLFKIANEPTPELTGFPSDFAELIGDCLQKPASRRPADAARLLERLEPVARPVPHVIGASDPPSDAPTTPTRRPAPRPTIDGTETTLHLGAIPSPADERRRRVASAGVGLVAGIALGFVGALWLGDRSAEPVEVPPVATAPADVGPPIEVAAPPLDDPRLAEAEAFLDGDDPGQIGTWLDRHPDVGHPDARDRLRGLARLAAGEVEAGVALLQAVSSRRPELAHDARTADALIAALEARDGEDAVPLLARLARRDVPLATRLVELAGSDRYRTRKRAYRAVDAADGDVALAGHRYYVRNLRVEDCDIRRNAVDRLRELGDPAAITPIRQMESRAGFFGNMCMDGAIERALGSLRRRRAELQRLEVEQASEGG